MKGNPLAYAVEVTTTEDLVTADDSIGVENILSESGWEDIFCISGARPVVPPS